MFSISVESICDRVITFYSSRFDISVHRAELLEYANERLSAMRVRYPLVTEKQMGNALMTSVMCYSRQICRRRAK